MGADCSGGPPDSGRDGDGDGDRDAGDGDGDGDSVVAVITAATSMTYGETLELDGSSSVNPSGGVLLFNWSLTDVPTSPVGGSCNGELLGNTLQLPTFTPLCVGDHIVALTVVDGSGQRSDTATHTISVARPTELTAMAASVNVWQHFSADLAGSYAGEVGDVTTTWSVDAPAGCSAAFGDASALTTTFTASCPGTHTLRIEVEDDIGRTESSFSVDVVASLQVALKDTNARFGEDALVTLTIDPASIPPSISAVEVTGLSAPAQSGTVVQQSAANDGMMSTWLVTPLVARGDFDLTASATVDGVTTDPPAVVTFVVDNNLPDADSTFPTVPLGGVADVSVDLTDVDLDTVTCSFSIADGATTGTAAPPLTVVDTTAALPGDTLCSVSVDLPDGVLDGFPLTVTLDDGFDSVILPPFTVCPEYNPPTVTSYDVDGPAAFSCDDSGCTTTNVVTVTVTGTDAETDDGLLSYELAVDDLPEGAEDVVVSGLDTEVSPGVFEVTFTRADRGPISGTYGLLAYARDQSPCAPNGLRSSGQPFDVLVANAPPTVTLTTDADVPHTWDSGSATYNATIDIAFDVVDPEANGLEPVIDIDVVTCGDRDVCPDAAVTYTAPSVADLAAGAISGSGAFTLPLSSTDLAPLAGLWEFEITVRDIDDGVRIQTVSLEVLNSVPTFDASDRTLAQQYLGNGLHGVTLGLGASDADGDPILFEAMQLSWTGGPLDVPGSISGASATFDNATGTIDVSSVPLPAGLLGLHVFSGTIHDGADEVPPMGAQLFTVTITNSPPVLGSPGASQSRNHRYNAGNVGVDPAEGLYAWSSSIGDGNGDPLVWRLGLDWAAGTLEPNNSAVTNGTPTVYGSTASWGFDITAPYADFLTTGDTHQVSAYVTDPFGATSTTRTLNVDLLNRTSSGVLTSSSLWGNGPYAVNDGTVSWDADSYDKVNDTATRKVREPSFSFPSTCSKLPGCPPYPVDFTLTTEIGADPDGDPVEVEMTASCNGNNDLAGLPSSGNLILSFPPGATSYAWDSALVVYQISYCGTGLSFPAIPNPAPQTHDVVRLTPIPPANVSIGVSCTISWPAIHDNDTVVSTRTKAAVFPIVDTSVGDTCK